MPPSRRPLPPEFFEDRMRRVVVTGLGIVSSIGNNAEEVTDSLRNARSGIVDYL